MCWNIYSTDRHRWHQRTHLVEELWELTPDPRVFTGFLWKTHTTIGSEGILEEYHEIRTSTNSRTIFLQKVFLAKYEWNGDMVVTTYI